VRAAALGALQAIGPAAAKVLPNLSQLLLDRWVAAKDPGVREALAKTLAAHLARLKSEEMTELLPLLRHKDSALVQVGLKVVQDRKADAAALAAEVAALLEHDDAAVRGAAAAALEALGPAASKALPGLTRLLLDRRAAEKDPAVRKALAGLLDTRLAALKPEEMTELRPLLRHKDPALVQVGLKIVGERKGDAATVADEVAALLEHDDGGVRKAALADLEALGPAARKALPRLYEILDNTPKHERTSLALTASRIVDFKDAESMRRLVPHLVAGLHPASLQNKGWKTEAAIDEVLLKIGQPAVEAIFAVLNPETRGKDEINYRKNLYDALAGLGPRCRSEDNYQRLRELRNREIAKKYTDVIEAAGRAVAAMAPE
jgi:succinate dehydrogenase flavin-adding protein (antitoxin of CptAB toxin-antitoxin module)